jgi:hypothetical protein
MMRWLYTALTRGKARRRSANVRWVINGKARPEHNTSALPPIATAEQTSRGSDSCQKRHSDRNNFCVYSITSSARKVAWEVRIAERLRGLEVARGQAMECQSEGQALSRAGAMSRDPANAGAIAFKRSGDPLLGDFSDAIVIKSFGEVPERLGEL